MGKGWNGSPREDSNVSAASIVRDGRTTVGDIEVGWSASGEGEPIVLVHGLAEDRHSWDPQLGAFPDARTIAYDIRGHGETTLGVPDGTLSQLGRDLSEFLEEMTGSATCVGFSLGGTVVLWLAAQRPELVRRVVVVATSSIVGQRAGKFYAQRIALARTGDHAALAAALRQDTAGAIARTDVDVDAVVQRRLAAIGNGEGYANAAAAMAGLREEPLTPLLSNVRCPVTVIGGEHDEFCPRKASDLLLGALPHGRYREIPGVGHLMNVEDPEAVTAAIDRELR